MSFSVLRWLPIGSHDAMLSADPGPTHGAVASTSGCQSVGHRIQIVGISDEQVLDYTVHDDGVGWTLVSSQQQRASRLPRRTVCAACSERTWPLASGRCDGCKVKTRTTPETRA